ncbi:MAG: hypothetical protein K5765_08920 [Clostridia bacterium]|nr:hypothetical protein [Clostridia bacterium]
MKDYLNNLKNGSEDLTIFDYALKSDVENSEKIEEFKSLLKNESVVKEETPIVGNGPELAIVKEKKQFSKKGILALILYSFVMAAVLTAVIVGVLSNRTTKLANASPIDESKKDQIEIMQSNDVENKENDNWFDRICDSLS